MRSIELKRDTPLPITHPLLTPPLTPTTTVGRYFMFVLFSDIASLCLRGYVRFVRMSRNFTCSVANFHWNDTIGTPDLRWNERLYRDLIL